MKKLADYPMYSFFESIKSYDRSLGHTAVELEAYLNLLDQIQKGRGLASKEDLYSICHLLFFKPYHREKDFRNLFFQYLALFEKDEKEPDSKVNGKDKKNLNQDLISDGDKAEEDPEDDNESFKLDPDDEMMDDYQDDPGINKEEYRAHTKVSIQFEESVKGGVIENPTLSQVSQLEREIYSRPFLLKKRYFPFSPRRMEQGIRSLRSFHNLKGEKIVDLEATIRRVTTNGYFDRLILKNASFAITPLTILIDWGGSMIAFHQMANSIVQATYDKHKQAGHRVYYFHDFPSENVYIDRTRVKPFPVHLLKNENQHSFLIFSDAGAARGNYSEERIKATKKFLGLIRHRPHAWLNPIPAFRWKGNSASEISDVIEMFDFTKEGFNRAMRWLKSAKTK